MARRMMKAQMDHALNRLREAYYDILGERPKIDPYEKNHELIRIAKSGKVKVTQAMVNRAITDAESELRRDGGRWSHGVGYFLAKEVDAAIDKHYKPVVNPSVALWEARKKKLDAKFKEVQDEIILGDVDRALKLIADFASFKV